MSSVATPEIHLDKNHFVKQMLVKMLQPVVQTNKVVYIYNKKKSAFTSYSRNESVTVPFYIFLDGCGGIS